MDSKEKLKDIQDFANDLNNKLCRDFSPEKFSKLINGWNLFLGSQYAKSENLFITYNPGISKNNHWEFNARLSPCNRYWDNLRDGEKDYAFWRNSRSFFKSQPLLKIWIGDATSTFLLPWRTDSIATFNKYPELKPRIHEYSGLPIKRMLEHHQAKTLVVSGVSTLRCLASDHFLNFDLKQSIDQSAVRNFGPNYQWGRVNPNRNYERLTIFQIPHFSRANSKDLLSKCSSWLWDEILKLKN